MRNRIIGGKISIIASGLRTINLYTVSVRTESETRIYKVGAGIIVNDATIAEMKFGM